MQIWVAFGPAVFSYSTPSDALLLMGGSFLTLVQGSYLQLEVM
jgi:hypothetical protein